MKQQSTRSNIWTFLLCLICTSNLAAQTGIIKGVIYENGEETTLPGANVYFKTDISSGTVSDIDGVFALNNAPLGSQVILVSYTGYETKEIEVTVVENKSTAIIVYLSPAIYKGEVVVVTAQALGQAKAINQQLNSEMIANIVSADRIQELPDVNAAEAIARLPGIAINRSGGEGQKVVIRGMAPKFAAITINGIRMPSNSGSDRSVDLSLISPELLDGIEVFKSPLPDMDAESIGGTVNLRLRKAPKEFKLSAKILGGFNDLNSDWQDYKSVLQISKRVLNDQLGVVVQASTERFNRGGDFLTNNWRQGATDSTGLTAIWGNSLRFLDQQEIRKRTNASLALDYNLDKSKFSLFGLYSNTTRDRFTMEENYIPSEPVIRFIGKSIENKLQLASLFLQGEHSLGKTTIDWTLASSNSTGETPYNFAMRFENSSQVFNSSLDANSHPRNYYDSATPNLEETFLRTANFNTSSIEEATNTAALNFKWSLKLGEKIRGYFKTGAKYSVIDRERNVDRLSEDFYYLGGEIGRDAIAASSNSLTLLPNNGELISILSFVEKNNNIDFYNESENNIGLKVSLDEQLIRQWYEDQKELLNTNRAVIVDRYGVQETIAATYAMLRLEFGDKLTIIPGFRYEFSDNEYQSGVSSLSGRYGVNGFFNDTTTVQAYGEFLPHLHLKYQAFDWLDIRASYATTLARPDFKYITPRSQINNNSLVITSGNPELTHAKAINYDLFISAYKGGVGLLSFGVFYKEIDNIFYPWRTNLFDQETADAFGWSDYKGYELRSYINAGKSTIKGFEVDLQTNLRFLPKPFNGLVLNVNYARLYSETESFFLTSETRLIIPVPPIFETIYTNNVRKVTLPNQSPHVFNISLGYDLKKFSARVSGSFQGTRANGYSSNKDFDRSTLHFWRWDASVKQKIKDRWSVFLNINNFTNQQDIGFTRSEEYINTIQTYGITGTVGIQYQIK